jgi:hypothetical protein
VPQRRTAAFIGQQAGKLLRRHVPRASDRPTAAQIGQQAGTFFKHVVPATIKPIHSLLHEVLAFVFLALAGSGGFKLYRDADRLGVVGLTIVGFLTAVMAGYGISSFRKARKISRS